jgi:ribonuclease III family protein
LNKDGYKLNGLTLAYIGDAYYELCIRNHLLNQKLTQVNRLHQQAVSYTSSVAQANIMNYLLESKQISEDEIDYFKKGRNQSGPGRKNVDAKTYHLATGFESLIGAMFLHNKNRADELIQVAIQYIERDESWRRQFQKN